MKIDLADAITLELMRVSYDIRHMTDAEEIKKFLRDRISFIREACREEEIEITTEPSMEDFYKDCDYLQTRTFEHCSECYRYLTCHAYFELQQAIKEK